MGWDGYNAVPGHVNPLRLLRDGSAAVRLALAGTAEGTPSAYLQADPHAAQPDAAALTWEEIYDARQLANSLARQWHESPEARLRRLGWAWPQPYAGAGELADQLASRQQDAALARELLPLLSQKALDCLVEEGTPAQQAQETAAKVVRPLAPSPMNPKLKRPASMAFEAAVPQKRCKLLRDSAADCSGQGASDQPGGASQSLCAEQALATTTPAVDSGALASVSGTGASRSEEAGWGAGSIEEQVGGEGAWEGGGGLRGTGPGPPHGLLQRGDTLPAAVAACGAPPAGAAAETVRDAISGQQPTAAIDGCVELGGCQERAACSSVGGGRQCTWSNSCGEEHRLQQSAHANQLHVAARCTCGARHWQGQFDATCVPRSDLCRSIPLQLARRAEGQRLTDARCGLALRADAVAQEAQACCAAQLAVADAVRLLQSQCEALAVAAARGARAVRLAGSLRKQLSPQQRHGVVLGGSGSAFSRVHPHVGSTGPPPAAAAPRKDAMRRALPAARRACDAACQLLERLLNHKLDGCDPLLPPPPMHDEIHVSRALRRTLCIPSVNAAASGAMPELFTVVQQQPSIAQQPSVAQQPSIAQQQDAAAAAAAVQQLDAQSGASDAPRGALARHAAALAAASVSRALARHLYLAAPSVHSRLHESMRKVRAGERHAAAHRCLLAAATLWRPRALAVGSVGPLHQPLAQHAAQRSAAKAGAAATPAAPVLQHAVEHNAEQVMPAAVPAATALLCQESGCDAGGEAAAAQMHAVVDLLKAAGVGPWDRPPPGAAQQLRQQLKQLLASAWTPASRRRNVAAAPATLAAQTDADVCERDAPQPQRERYDAWIARHAPLLRLLVAKWQLWERTQLVTGALAPPLQPANGRTPGSVVSEGSTLAEDANPGGAAAAVSDVVRRASAACWRRARTRRLAGRNLPLLTRARNLPLPERRRNLPLPARVPDVDVPVAERAPAEGAAQERHVSFLRKQRLWQVLITHQGQRYIGFFQSRSAASASAAASRAALGFGEAVSRPLARVVERDWRMQLARAGSLSSLAAACADCFPVRWEVQLLLPFAPRNHQGRPEVVPLQRGGKRGVASPLFWTPQAAQKAAQELQAAACALVAGVAVEARLDELDHPLLTAVHPDIATCTAAPGGASKRSRLQGGYIGNASKQHDAPDCPPSHNTGPHEPPAGAVNGRCQAVKVPGVGPRSEVAQHDPHDAASVFRLAEGMGIGAAAVARAKQRWEQLTGWQVEELGPPAATAGSRSMCWQ